MEQFPEEDTGVQQLHAPHAIVECGLRKLCIFKDLSYCLNRDQEKDPHISNSYDIHIITQFHILGLFLGHWMFSRATS